MPTKLEANASFKKPRLVFLVLALALIFSVVFVGGVSGAEFNVYTETDLRSAVTTSNGNGEDDLIIIRANIVLYNSEPIEITTGQITIQNEYGKSYTISRDDSSYSERILWVVSRYSPIFSVTGGEFILGGAASGSLILHGDDKIITKPGGGAIYVNGGSFVLNDGVSITEFGLLGSELSGDGAVYIDSGSFTMNGGNITNCVSMMGSGVYVSSDGRFEMMGGEITTNGHNDLLWGIIDSTYGGGVFVEDNGVMISSGDKTLDKMIHDNLGSPQYVYNNPDKTRYYIVKHFFYDIDGRNPVENEALRQTAAGNYDELTNAKPYSITGYVNDTITQKTIANNIVNEIVDDTKTTVVEVYYRVSISYEITIPANLIIAENTKTGTLILTPTELWILDTGTVVVSVSSENNFNLAYTDDADSKVSYELKDGDRVIKQNDNVAEFTLANPDAVSISAKLTGHPPYVGTYSDLLTFTAEYVDPAFS